MQGSIGNNLASVIVDVNLPRLNEALAAPETARGFGADAVPVPRRAPHGRSAARARELAAVLNPARTGEPAGTGVGDIAQNIPVQAIRGTA